MKRVVRTGSYRDDLDDIERYIALDSPRAAAEMWLYIDDQVRQLADPMLPRRRGRVADTFELVVHENYIVILEEDATTVTVLHVLHSRKKYP